MFPEFRDLISELKTRDAHFSRLFDQHNELDQRIKNIEARIEPGSAVDVENMKKAKLRLKDELYTLLRSAG